MVRRRGLAVLLLVLLVPVPPGTRGEEDGPRPRRIPFEHPLPNEVDSFGIYYGRRKVGSGFQSLRLESADPSPRYHSRSVFRAEVYVPGQRGVLDFDGSDTFRGEAPFELLATKERSVDGDATRTIRLERDGDGYAGSVRTEEDVRPVSFPDLDYSMVDRMTHVEWIRSHPAVGDVLAVREFNITRLAEEIVRYEVVQRKRVMASAVSIEMFEVDMRSSAGGRLGKAWFDAEGRLLRMTIAGALEIRLEHEGQAREERYPSELFAFGRAPAVDPFGDPREIARMDIRAFGRGAQRIPVTPRQQVRIDRDLQTVYVRVEAGRTDLGERLTDPEAWLGPTSRYPTGDPRARRMARKAVGAAETDEEKVEALVRFVSEHLRDAYVPYEPTFANLLLDPIGDGSEHALLFTLLARASGLPAREVQGLVYLGDEVQAFGGHVWNQVGIDGRWVEVDPTWTQRHVDGSHVLLHVGDRDVVDLLARTRHLAIERGSVERRVRTDPRPQDDPAGPGR